MTDNSPRLVIDITLIAPVIGVAGLLDVLLHIRLDLQKRNMLKEAAAQDHDLRVSSWAMALVAISTLLSFLIVLLFLIGLGPLFVQVGLLFDPPLLLSLIAIGLTLFGIFLHSWSRYVRQEMASSWAMSSSHCLVTKGPYAKVRHPSYTSYMLTFIGLFLFIPNWLTLLTLVGIPGYYQVSTTEEKLLVAHLGDKYKEYCQRTGRFLPI
jgi:protein-S-isoprenylcysteine O-methyltransferase Ste14